MKKSTKTFLIVVGITTISTIATVAVVKAYKKLKNDLSTCAVNDMDFTGRNDCLRCECEKQDKSQKYDYSTYSTCKTEGTYALQNDYLTKSEIEEMIDEAMSKTQNKAE